MSGKVSQSSHAQRHFSLTIHQVTRNQMMLQKSNFDVGKLSTEDENAKKVEKTKIVNEMMVDSTAQFFFPVSSTF